MEGNKAGASPTKKTRREEVEKETVVRVRYRGRFRPKREKKVRGSWERSRGSSIGGKWEVGIKDNKGLSRRTPFNVESRGL